MKCKILNIKNSLIIKTPLMIESEPFFYIKMNKDCNNYRVSFNYDHLNKTYGIKFNFIRNLGKISIKKNDIFDIINDRVNIIYDDKNQKLKDGLYNIQKELFNAKVLDSKINNSCQITKFIFKNKYADDDLTTIFILKRIYENDVNYSMLFSSRKYYKIDDFLETIL